MRRAGWPVLVVILVFYGLALARIEALYGQAALRPFVGDIEGEVYLYALNTTVSAALLLTAGVLWGAMLVVDGALPADLPLRLAAEEVTKVWGAALLAAWAWTRLGAMAVAPLPSEPSVNEG